MRQTKLALAAVAAGMMFTVASAQGQTGPLSPTITPLAFLVGSWTSEQGHAERDEARGKFRIEAAAGGKALLRREHTEVVSARGGPMQSVDQIMLIYPEDGHLRGDYFDGTHAIHYQDAQVEPGRSVRFTTSTIAGTSVPAYLCPADPRASFDPVRDAAAAPGRLPDHSGRDRKESKIVLHSSSTEFPKSICIEQADGDRVGINRSNSPFIRN